MHRTGVERIVVSGKVKAALARSKVGSAKKLAITVRFQGNTLLKPSTKNLSVKIKR